MNLGDLYQMGWGVRTDKKRAAELYRLAVERNEPTDFCRYAAVLQHGEGVKRDPKAAGKWEKKFCDAEAPGDADCRCTKRLSTTLAR